MARLSGATTLIATVALFVVLGSGCASLPMPPSAQYRFQVVDEPRNRQFEFELTSLDDRALCISADDWPVVRGDSLSGVESLVTTSGTVKAKDIVEPDAGMMCALSGDPDCGTIRLESHQSFNVQIPYALFADPDVLAADTGKHFDLHPDYPFVRVCGRKPS